LPPAGLSQQHIGPARIIMEDPHVPGVRILRVPGDARGPLMRNR
jgi:hypothetical protein